jgi:putative ABC transport system permease protein
VNIAVTLAWRYLWGRKLRTALTTLAVVFGVSVLFGMGALIPTMSETFTKVLFASAGQVDLSVTNASGSTFDSSIAEQVAGVEGVKAATPVLLRPVGMPKTSPVSSIQVAGIEPRTAEKVRHYAVGQGVMLSPGDRGVVLLGKSLATQANLRVGGYFDIPSINGTKRYRVIGILGSASPPGTQEAFLTLADAQQLFGEGNRASEVDATFVNGVDRTLVEARVRRELGSDYNVGGIAPGSELLSSLKMAEFIFNMFGVFALAMGGFIILNTFRTVVAERRHDIGMLRAVGARRRTILGIFLVESLLQGILGTALGLLAGAGMAMGLIAALNPLYKRLVNMTVGAPQFQLSSLTLAIVMGIGVTVLGALSPALAASRITPLEALRPQVGEVEDRQRGRRAWIGVGILVFSAMGLVSGNASALGLGSVGVLVGLVLVAPELVGPISNAFAWLIDAVFRSEGEIARSNMQRQPSRAATTAAAVMISLAIIISLLGVMSSIVGGFLDYVDKSVAGADFIMLPTNLLLAGGNVGASNELVTDIRNTPGVNAVATLRIAKTQVDGSPAQVIGLDPVEYPKVATFEFSGDGQTSDIGKLAHGRGLIANGLFAAQNGLKVGQRVKVTTVNGEKTFSIIAIGSDYLNAKLATVYISQERLKEDFGTESNALVLANLSPGADAPQVKRQLATLVADYPQLTLYDTTSFKETQKVTMSQVMIGMYGLVVVLAIPTLLALLNNLAMSVIARTREIGMLRALGSTRRQVRRMVMAEALFLASVGVTFGVISGIVLSYAMVAATNNVGWKIPFYFPTGGVIAAVIAGFGFSLLAAVIPSRSAAKLDIVAALHYE